MAIYAETSGTSGDPIYEDNAPRSAWGLSWGYFWGNSWGFLRTRPPFGSSTNSPGPIFEEGSGSGPFLYNTSSGTNPDPIYGEN